MNEPNADGERREPGDRPATGRRLERPPSERYREIAYGQSGAATQEWHGTAFNALFGGVAAGLAGAGIFTVAAGGLSFDWGLPVIAAGIGWSVGEGVRIGAGRSLDAGARRGVALALALLALTAAEVATWMWAHSQGGNLPLLDHLWTTYGPLLVVQYVATVLAALWTAR